MRRSGSLARMVIAAALIAGCGCANRGRPELLVVPPPPDLADLNDGVRQQHQKLDTQVADLLGQAATSNVDLGAAFGQLGRWHHAYKYFDNAEKAYLNAAALCPDDARWPYYLAVVNEQLGRFREARRHLLAAAELGAPSQAVWVRCGRVALALGAEEEAEACFRTAVEEDPECAAALLGLSQLAITQGDAAAALSLAERALALQPEASELFHVLARALLAVGEKERASSFLERVPKGRTELRRVAFVDPWMREVHNLCRSARTLARQGHAAYRSGQYRRAANFFSRSLSVDPGNDQVRTAYALALAKLGRGARAIGQLERVFDQSPEQVGAHVALGQVLLQRREFGRAEEHFRAAVRLDRSPVNLARLAGLMQRMGRLEDAVELFTEARSSGLPLAGCRLWRTISLVQLGRYREAVDSIREDVALLPGDGALHMLAARLLAACPEAELRDGPSALEHAERAVAVAPRVAAAEAMAMALAENADFARAVAWQAAAARALEGARDRANTLRAQRRLTRYRQGRACRQPWAEDEGLITVLVEAP